MSQVGEWVKEVFMVILSITLIEMMLPEGNLSKYVKFIYAIIILAIILLPLSNFVHK